MKPFDVLVISPDNKQAEAEVSGLGVCGLSAEAVHSVREALWQLNTHSYSFILLDQKTAESEMLMEAVKWGRGMLLLYCQCDRTYLLFTP